MEATNVKTPAPITRVSSGPKSIVLIRLMRMKLKASKSRAEKLMPEICWLR
jgi:hypothetical protein